MIQILFRPKVILVEERGSLVGLVTIKDVLRFMEIEHRDASWDDPDGLSGVLEEAYTWTTQTFGRVFEWMSSFAR
jgi:chloride channel 3/4/5